MNSVTAIDKVINEYWSVYMAEQAQAEYDELKSRVDTAEATAKEYQTTVEAYRVMQLLDQGNQARLEKDVKYWKNLAMMYAPDREVFEA